MSSRDFQRGIRGRQPERDNRIPSGQGPRSGITGITKAGWIYILVTLFVCLSAVNTGNNLVYIVASALLSYLVVSGIMGTRNILNLDARIFFPDDVFARTDVLATVKVWNRRRWMPAFLISVKARGQECVFPYIAPKSSVSGTFAVTFEKRGRVLVHDVSISSSFPFDFFRRFRRVRRESELIVYPKPLRCGQLLIDGSEPGSRGGKEKNKPGYDSDILAIRDYVPGDPPKYINWKSTAKTGRLKTKELSGAERRQVTIDLDAMEKKDLETALSCVTHAALGFMRSGIPVGLRIEGEAIKPGISAAHRRSVLTRLALYGQN